MKALHLFQLTTNAKYRTKTPRFYNQHLTFMGKDNYVSYEHLLALKVGNGHFLNHSQNLDNRLNVGLLAREIPQLRTCSQIGQNRNFCMGGGKESLTLINNNAQLTMYRRLCENNSLVNQEVIIPHQINVATE